MSQWHNCGMVPSNISKRETSFGKSQRPGRAHSGVSDICWKCLRGLAPLGQGKSDAGNVFIVPLCVATFAEFSETSRKMTMDVSVEITCLVACPDGEEAELTQRESGHYFSSPSFSGDNQEKMVLNLFFQAFILFLVVCLGLLLAAPSHMSQSEQ